MTATVDRGPSRSGLLLAGAATLTALAALLFASPSAAVVTLFGAVVLAAGVQLDGAVLRDLGTLAMLGGPIAGGFAGGEPSALLVATVAVAVARDATDNAIAIGAQLGANTRTLRAEAVHAAATTVVGVAAALAGYAVFRIAGSGRPLTAVVVLLVGGLLLVVALRT